MVRVSLQQWVQSKGSLRAASDFLDIPLSTLGAYCRGARYPHPLIMRQLKERIGDVVDLDSLSDTWAAHKSSSPSPRLLRANIIVNTSEKLSRVFEEAGLSCSGLSNAPPFLARWKTTNVTVKEVRTAIDALREEKKDPASVRLIHESIGAARRKNLGAITE